MEGSKDSGSSLHFPDESDDGNGLELSLGLSYNGTKGKGKEMEGSRALMTESPFERGKTGNGAAGKPKPGRANGLDAALKRFLEGRLEEQDESGRMLDKYSPNFCSRADGNKSTFKEDDVPSSANVKGIGAQEQGLQEKPNRSDLQEGKETLGVSNDTNISGAGIADAATAVWSQLQQQGVPAHLINAWKNQVGGVEMVDSGTSWLLPHSETSYSPLGPTGNQDSAKHDSEKVEQPRQLFVHRQILDQQRKFQEARKKRKNAIEEQKQQKQSKKEDDERAGLHGNDDEHLSSEKKELTSREKILEIDQEESSETLNDCNDNDASPMLKVRLSHHFTSETTDSGKEKNDIWKQRQGETHVIAKCKADVIENSMENWKNTSNLSLHRLAEPSYATSISPSRRETGRSSCQNSSTGSQSSEKREIPNGGGEISSAVPGNATASGPASGSSQSPIANTSALSHPLGSSLFAVPMPPSLPVPLTNSSSMPFPGGFPFPYLLQFVPPSGDSSPALHLNSLQLPVAQGYMQYPLPALESATSWIPAMRPPIASALFGPSSGVPMTGTTTGILGEEEKLQGANVLEIQNPATLAGASMEGSDQPRTASLRCTQDSIVDPTQPRQEADSQLFSLLPVTAAAQLNLLQSLPGSGECSVKEQAEVGAFHSFATSARLVNTSSLNGGQEQGLAGQNVARNDDTVNKESNRCDKEELRNGLDNPFQRGSTENVPNLDSLSPELLGLRPGISSGLKFGGTGSCPDLPWVSTTGSGPTGKTISGVLYRCNGNQVRIVCACHGKHLAPGEFIHHANDLEGSNMERRILGNSAPFINQEDSAQG